MVDALFLSKIKRYTVEANSLSKLLEMSLIYVAPIVTVSDAKSGYITRYFAYPLNEPFNLVEIDQDKYQKVTENFLFVTTSVEWKIVGKKESYTTSYGVRVLGVEDFNRNQVTQVDLTFKNLHKYINDYTQYWLGETI